MSRPFDHCQRLQTLQICRRETQAAHEPPLQNERVDSQAAVHVHWRTANG
jgi:hypothetical protein